MFLQIKTWISFACSQQCIRLLKSPMKGWKTYFHQIHHSCHGCWRARCRRGEPSPWRRSPPSTRCSQGSAPSGPSLPVSLQQRQGHSFAKSIEFRMWSETHLWLMEKYWNRKENRRTQGISGMLAEATYAWAPRSSAGSCAWGSPGQMHSVFPSHSQPIPQQFWNWLRRPHCRGFL